MHTFFYSKAFWIVFKEFPGFENWQKTFVMKWKIFLSWCFSDGYKVWVAEFSLPSFISLSFPHFIFPFYFLSAYVLIHFILLLYFYLPFHFQSTFLNFPLGFSFLRALLIPPILAPPQWPSNQPTVCHSKCKLLHTHMSFPLSFISFSKRPTDLCQVTYRPTDTQPTNARRQSG